MREAQTHVFVCSFYSSPKLHRDAITICEFTDSTSPCLHHTPARFTELSIQVQLNQQHIKRKKICTITGFLSHSVFSLCLCVFSKTEILWNYSRENHDTLRMIVTVHSLYMSYTFICHKAVCFKMFWQFK